MLLFPGVSNCLIFLFISSVYLSLSFPISATKGNSSSNYIFYIFTHITCPIGSEFFLVPSPQKTSCVGPGPSRRDARVRLNVPGGGGESYLGKYPERQGRGWSRLQGLQRRQAAEKGGQKLPRRPCTPRKFPQSCQGVLKPELAQRRPGSPATSLPQCP